MRYSVLEGDPGHAAWLARGGHWSRGVRVTLNGIEVREIFTVDDERGEIVRLARDEFGNILIDGDDVVHETLHGRVEIYDSLVSDSGQLPGCRTSRDLRTGTGPQPDAGPGSPEAGRT